MVKLLSSSLKRLSAGLAGAALLGLGACASDPAATVTLIAPQQAAPSAPAAPSRAVLAFGSAAQTMPLAGPAAAPLGYLRFCARQPDQCGPEATTLQGGSADDVAARQSQFYAKYYWPAAFQSGTPGALRLTPTFGLGASAPAAPASGPARFDWSSVFGPAAPGGQRAMLEPAVAIAAPSAPAAKVAVSEVPVPAPAPAPTDTAAAQPMVLTDATLQTLNEVNLRINRSIRYESDLRQFGIEDYWTLPLESGGPAAGDCKDYVLEKRRALAADGVPAQDLSIAIVRTRWGETHAVLLVATDRGELVLDSLSPRILPWRSAGYSWIERQSPGSQLAWVKIGAGAS